jgi:hypothetical protein
MPILPIFQLIGGQLVRPFVLDLWTSGGHEVIGRFTRGHRAIRDVTRVEVPLAQSPDEASRSAGTRLRRLRDLARG